MRVLFAQTTPYLPQESGGALSSTDAMCRLLLEQGADVQVLAGDAGRLADRFRLGASRSFPYPIVRATYPLKAAQEISNAQRPDVAVVQLGDVNGLIGCFLQNGIPTLLYVHDQYTFDSLEGQLRSDRRVSFATCSSFIAGHILERAGRPSAVLPVLVEPRLYRVDSSRSFATFVNPIPRKGSEIVFALAACRPDIPFAFVEAWKLRHRVMSYLEARAAHYGNIRIVRRTQDMREIYASTRIVVAPSQGSEAWGRVVSEGQVSGIPALVSNSGGLPEAVGQGGIVVERHAAISEWASALSTLWDDPASYDSFSTKARMHAERPDFTPADIAERAIALLKTLSGQ